VLNTLEAKTTFLAQTLGKLEAFYEQSSFPVEERPIFHIRERMKKGYEEVFYINERTILTFTFFPCPSLSILVALDLTVYLLTTGKNTKQMYTSVFFYTKL